MDATITAKLGDNQVRQFNPLQVTGKEFRLTLEWAKPEQFFNTKAVSLNEAGRTNRVTFYAPIVDESSDANPFDMIRMYAYEYRGDQSDNSFLNYRAACKPRSSPYYNLAARSDDLTKITIDPTSKVDATKKLATLKIRRPFDIEIRGYLNLNLERNTVYWAYMSWGLFESQNADSENDHRGPKWDSNAFGNYNGFNNAQLPQEWYIDNGPADYLTSKYNIL